MIVQSRKTESSSRVELRDLSLGRPDLKAHDASSGTSPSQQTTLTVAEVVSQLSDPKTAALVPLQKADIPIYVDTLVARLGSSDRASRIAGGVGIEQLLLRESKLATGELYRALDMPEARRSIYPLASEYPPNVQAELALHRFSGSRSKENADLLASLSPHSRDHARDLMRFSTDMTLEPDARASLLTALSKLPPDRTISEFLSRSASDPKRSDYEQQAALVAQLAHLPEKETTSRAAEFYRTHPRSADAEFERSDLLRPDIPLHLVRRGGPGGRELVEQRLLDPTLAELERQDAFLALRDNTKIDSPQGQRVQDIARALASDPSQPMELRRLISAHLVNTSQGRDTRIDPEGQNLTAESRALLASPLSNAPATQAFYERGLRTFPAESIRSLAGLRKTTGIIGAIPLDTPEALRPSVEFAYSAEFVRTLERNPSPDALGEIYKFQKDPFSSTEVLGQPHRRMGVEKAFPTSSEIVRFGERLMAVGDEGSAGVSASELRSYGRTLVESQRSPEPITQPFTFSPMALKAIVDGRSVTQSTHHVDVVFPTTDWNGAFKQTDFIDDFVKQGYTVRLHTASNPETAQASIVQRLGRSMGSEGHTIVFSGHGTKTSSELGPIDSTNPTANTLDVTDSAVFQGLAPAIRPHTKIILNACSTGEGREKDRNLVNVVAEQVPGLTPGSTFGPTISTSISRIVFKDRQPVTIQYAQSGPTPDEKQGSSVLYQRD